LLIAGQRSRPDSRTAGRLFQEKAAERSDFPAAYYKENIMEPNQTQNTESQKLIDMAGQYGADNYHPLPIVLATGKGVWVKDPEGNKYMDMLSAYSALNHGHRHPRVIKALVQQAKLVTLTSRAFNNSQLGLFLKELCEYSGYEMALPMNTGAEAVETALKAVRKWGYKVKGVAEDKAEIITAANNFHGRTITTVSFSTEHQYKDGFGPFTPGFKTVPYGDIEALKGVVKAKETAEEELNENISRLETEIESRDKKIHTDLKYCEDLTREVNDLRQKIKAYRLKAK